MRSALLLSAVLLAGPALAQTPPPPPAAPPPPPADATRPPPPRPMTGRGAFIKLEGPRGASIAIRCADGEPTKVCADIMTDILDKVRTTMRADRGRGEARGDDQNWRRDERGGGRRWERDDD